MGREEFSLMWHLGKTVSAERKKWVWGERKVWDTVWSLHRVDEKWAAEGEEPGGVAAMWQKREMGCIKMKWCFAKLDCAAAALLLWGRGPTSKLFPETSLWRQNAFRAVVRSSFQGDLLCACSLKPEQHGAKAVFFFSLLTQYFQHKLVYTQYNKVQKSLPAIFRLIFRSDEQYQKFWQRGFLWWRF